MRWGEDLNMLSSGQKQCQRQREAVGGLDSASPGYWCSYLPAMGLRLPKADTHLQGQCKGCQCFLPIYLQGGGPALQEPVQKACPYQVVTICRWHTVRTWRKNYKHSLESSLDTPSSCHLSSFRPSRNSSLGIYPRYSSQSWEKPGINQVGRPVRRCLQIFKIRSCGSALGKEEKQQQHDLWETQPGYEVSWDVAVEDRGT